MGALRAAHDPYTPQHIRAQAYEACEAVKSSFDSAFGAARALLGAAGADDLSRHFGLLLLDELVTTKWNALSPEQCEALKQTAHELVQSVRAVNMCWRREMCHQLVLRHAWMLCAAGFARCGH